MDPEDTLPEEEEDQDQDQDQDGRHLVTFPPSFVTSAESRLEEVCVQMKNVEGAGAVTLSFWADGKSLAKGEEPDAFVTFTVPAGGDLFCDSLKLTEEAGFKSGTAFLRVQGSFPDYQFSSYRPVKVISFQPLLLVQTDKGDYQPEQTVKFRVMALDSEVRPSAEITELAEVWLTDPSDSRLAQWKEVKLNTGMAQLEYSLPEETPLGGWVIHVRAGQEKDEAREHTASFTVSERVLPKFEVTLEGPEVVRRDSQEEKFKVCAVYTHGGSVNGKVNATFTSSYWSREHRETRLVSVSKILPLEDGCAQAELNREEIFKLSNQTYDFRLSASVTEAVTTTKRSVDGYYRLVDTPFFIRRGVTSHRHVLGGFPVVQEIKVQSHDKGNPGLEGVNLEVCARLFRDVQPARDKMNRLRYSSNEDELLELSEVLSRLLFEKTCVRAVSGPGGVLKVAVPIYSAPENVTKLSLRVKAVDYPANKEARMLQPDMKVHT